MKLIYIILSTIFVVACSDIDLNGYTDSIVKKTALEDGSKHYALYKEGDNPPTTNCEDKTISHAENQTIIDRTCLTVNHNPFTGEIQIIDPVQDFPYAWVDEKQPYKYGIDNLPNDCMPLKNTNSSANALPIQCFDTFNPEKGEDYTPTIFISAKIDENDPTKLNTNSYSSSSSQNSSSSYCQGISLNLSNMLKGQTYDNYYIAHEWVYDIQSEDASKLQRVQNIKDDDITGKQQHCINISKIEDSGIHSIYGAQKSSSRASKRTSSSRTLNIKLINIKVIPYKPITKGIRYIQISGNVTADNTAIEEETSCTDNDYNECEIDTGLGEIEKHKYTRCCVKKYFDLIFAPAMVNASVRQYPYQRMLLSNSYYRADTKELQTRTMPPANIPGTGGNNMPDPEKYSTYYSNDNEGNSYLKEPYFQNGLINIDFSNIEKVNEFGNTLLTNALKLDHSQTKENGPEYHVVYAVNKVRKIWKLKDCLDNRNAPSCFLSRMKNEPSDVKYFTYNNRENKFPGKEVEILYEKVTYKENGKIKEPAYRWRIRYKTSNSPLRWSDFQDDDYIYTENGYPTLPFKSVMVGSVRAFAARLDANYQNELGKNGIFLSKGSVVFVARGPGHEGFYVLMHELGHTFGLTDVAAANSLQKIEEDIPSKDSKNYTADPSTSQNDYATQYTNLMSWVTPQGSKIRYRPTQIACTGGRSFHANDDKRENIDITDKDNYYNLMMEYSIPIEKKEDAEINQWECIRKCNQDIFVKGGRIDYWGSVAYWGLKANYFDKDPDYNNNQRCISSKYTTIENTTMYQNLYDQWYNSTLIKK